MPPWQRTWWAYTLFILLFVSAVWLFVSLRSRSLKRENRILEKKIEDRTVQLKQSLENLKSTQAQLIQSEKMASLGELTAGIAHEIQNPLNFVNNFSDVNTELIDEASLALNSGNDMEARELLSNIRENEEKIRFHGQRAGVIINGMLQHTRSSTGLKEPTDINALAAEYLRLSYQGMRAKEKSFQADMQTDFDTIIGRMNIVPQDIGRVLLNLYNNAFYAVYEKNKQHPEGYEPTVFLKTKRNSNIVEIRVKDNGIGISQKIIDKIFQPFFTTKPTGQGTGLGLSLSYDIIKAHGGELKVDSREGEGAEFIVQLPLLEQLQNPDSFRIHNPTSET
jgi:signal transduction histidine kinase